MNYENDGTQNSHIAKINVNRLHAAMEKPENRSEKAYQEFKAVPMAIRCKYENKVCDSGCRHRSTCIQGKAKQ